VKYDIDCPDHSEDKRGWEITPDGRVWPCCYFANAWSKRHADMSPETELLYQDQEFVGLMDEDPGWNNLKSHSLAEITEHKYYWTKIWYPGWNSDNPNPICAIECGKAHNDITNEYRSKSILSVKKVK